MARLTIPSGRHFTTEEVECLLELDSLPGPTRKQKKPETKAKSGKRLIKNTPQTMGKKCVKFPATSKYRPGVILPKHEPNTYSSCYNASLGQSCSHSQTSYNEFGNMTRLILPGNITKENFAKLQNADPKYGKLFKQKPIKKNFKILDNHHFKFPVSPYRLVLPSSLLDAVINSKHFSLMGLHFSKSRIRRDVLAKYHCNVRDFNKKIQNLLSSCIQCQMNSWTPTLHTLKQHFVYGPRTSWSVDLIPSLTKTEKGHSAIFLAVDMFMGYIQLQPLKTRQTSELIEAIKNKILAPFRVPKYF